MVHHEIAFPGETDRASEKITFPCTTYMFDKKQNYTLLQLINQKCAGDMALVEMLVNGLLGRLVDNSHVVRKLCIRGLGNVASNGPEQVG